MPIVKSYDIEIVATCILTGESATDVWEPFVQLWEVPYVGDPNNIANDQGLPF